MKKVFIFYFLLIPLFCSSQSNYNYAKETLGTWVGSMSGGGLPSKIIKLVITKANYKSGKTGYCEGYSTVNNSNKTDFTGNLFVDCDSPHIEGFEPKTSPKNGVFFLSWGCFDEECFKNDENLDVSCCGTWISYDKKIKRRIKVKKNK